MSTSLFTRERKNTFFQKNKSDENKFRCKQNKANTALIVPKIYACFVIENNYNYLHRK